MISRNLPIEEPLYHPKPPPTHHISGPQKFRHPKRPSRCARAILLLLKVAVPLLTPLCPLENPIIPNRHPNFPHSIPTSHPSPRPVLMPKHLRATSSTRVFSRRRPVTPKCPRRAIHPINVVFGASSPYNTSPNYPIKLEIRATPYSPPQTLP